MLAAAPFFAGEAERSGKRGDCAAFNEALPLQQRLKALQKVRACICFQHSAYTARTATQCAALHSAQRCTLPSAAQCPALHCAQRFTAPSASLRPALHCAQRRTVRNIPALHSAQHCTAPGIRLHRAEVSEVHKQLIHCAHRCTSSLNCAQHCTSPPPPPLQHCTARSTAQRAALHSAQHCIAPSTASHLTVP